MVYAFSFLMAALLIKDTTPVGDVYVLRSLSQGLCLTLGFWWLFTQGSIAAVRRYWLILAYSGILCGTAFASTNSGRVLLQVLSLIAVALFFMSFCEQARQAPAMHTIAARIVIYSLLSICIGSLLLYKVAPTLAFDQTVERFVWDSSHRFKGLFGKPAGIAAASGLLLGLCAFTKVHWLIRATGALSSVLCLYLTLSRSFWVGAIVALVATIGLYVKRKSLLMIVGIGGLLFAIAMVAIMDTKMTGWNQSKAMRADSLEIYRAARRFGLLPSLDFGIAPCLGTATLSDTMLSFTAGMPKRARFPGTMSISFAMKPFRYTMDMYKRCLIRVGWGTLIYVVIMGLTVWRVMRFDTTKVHANVLYSLVFLSIANIGETVVYTPATFHATYYWYIAILALGLRPSAIESLVPPVATDAVAEPVRTSRYPLLSHPTT